MKLAQLRAQLSSAGRQIYELGLVTGYSGNLSARDPDTGLILIKPSAVHWQAIEPEDIVVMDLEGEVVEGTRSPSIENPLHRAIYRKFESVGAVLHTHSTYATGFAVAHRSIPPVCVNSAEIGGEVPVVPFHRPGTEALARAVVAGLRDRPVVLLASHGVVCVGEDLPETISRNVVLEEVAHLALIREMLGSASQLTDRELGAI
jgi:L-ribulose-5-phosphate 4-epimerase